LKLGQVLGEWFQQIAQHPLPMKCARLGGAGFLVFELQQPARAAARGLLSRLQKKNRCEDYYPEQ
jgi:hypothetical protein